jgi:uncharacterized protein (TIGR02996 family)
MHDSAMLGLLDAIKEAPDDLDLYLILADRLEELDDPRARIIRLQVERQRLKRGDPRILTLLDEELDLIVHSGEPWRGTPPEGVQVTFCRGLSRVFAPSAPKLLHPWLESHDPWIVELHMYQLRELRQLTTQGYLVKLPKLTIGWLFFGDRVSISTQDQDLKELGRLRNLQELNLVGENDLTNFGLKDLANITTLRTLSLGPGHYNPEGIRYLREHLPHCTIQAAGLRYFPPATSNQ